MTTSPYTPNQVQPSSFQGVKLDGPLTSAASCCHDLDATKRDRFELLSAYLDGEVTSEERQQVLRWIQHDDGTRRLYNRLLALRQGIRNQSAPPDCSAEATLAGVFQCLNYRLKLATMASAGVVAIGVINLLSGAGIGTPSWRMATVAQPEALEIALDKPAFPIPEEASAVISTDFTSPLEAGGLPIDSEL